MTPFKTFILTMVIMTIVITGCVQEQAGAPDFTMVALMPQTITPNSPIDIDIVLQEGDEPSRARVNLELTREGQTSPETRHHQIITGSQSMRLPPPGDAGRYTLRISGIDHRGNTFDQAARVDVVGTTSLILQTDRPTYRPGDTLRLRTLSMDGRLRPVQDDITFDIRDADGASVHQETITTGPHGIAETQIPLSTEPRTGNWNISARTRRARAYTTVLVDNYTLPKYEVRLAPHRTQVNWGQEARGEVITNYAFDKPATGTLTITPHYRQKGRHDWTLGEPLALKTNGVAAYSFPTAPKWNGELRITAKFQENPRDQGHTAETVHVVTEPRASLSVHPASSTVQPGLPFQFTVTDTQWDDQDIQDKTLEYRIEYTNKALSKKTLHNWRKTELQRGTSVIRLTTPQNVTSLTLKLKDPNGQQVYHHMDASHSPNQSYIQLESLQQGPLDPGDQAGFKIHAKTKNIGQFQWQALAGNTPILSGRTDQQEFSVPITPEMHPRVHVLVYAVTGANELLSSNAHIQVNQAYPMEVTLATQPREPQPGENVRLQVRTQPRSLVALQGVDRATHFLQQQNITPQTGAAQPRWNNQSMRHRYGHRQNHAFNPSAAKIIEAHGLTVISNTPKHQGRTLSRKKRDRDETPWTKRTYELIMSASPMILLYHTVNQQSTIEPVGGTSLQSGGARTTAPPDTGQWYPQAQPESPEEQTRVRTNFPETWLWDLQYAGDDGNLELDLTAPDSITTWELQAIALSQQHGLGIASAPVTVTQPLFIHAQAPPRAIRDETIPLTATVHNYSPNPQQVTVSLEPSKGVTPEGPTEHTVLVPSQGNTPVDFFLKVREAGMTSIRLHAKGENHADAVDTVINVRYPGVTKVDTNTITIGPGQTSYLNTQRPENAVTGTFRSRLEITSNPMTKPIRNIGQWLKRPYGCAEQNMSVVGPNAQILQYLDTLPEPNEAVRQEAIRLMQAGYQRQLTFQLSDGSFSSFQNPGADKNTWLTAYTLRTLAQVQQHIYVDPTTLQRAADWLQNRQNSDGSFPYNSYEVHNASLVNGSVANTAYTALALMETQAQYPLLQATAYLEQRVLDSMQPNTRAMVSLLLARMGSPQAQTSIDLLLASSRKTDEGHLSWGTKYQSIEATAYAAMALHLTQHHEEANMAREFLIAHQNPWGGYTDTHSTAIAIEALRTLEADRPPTTGTLTLNLSAGEWSETISMDTTVPHQAPNLPLPPDVSQVRVTAQGEGQAYVTTVRVYNTIPRQSRQEDYMQLQVSADNTLINAGDQTTITARLEYRLKAPEQSGMITVEIENPTGLKPIPASLDTMLSDNPKVMRADDQDGRTIVYIDWMEPGETIEFHYDLIGPHPVQGRPAGAEAYAYYQPHVWTSATLTPVEVRR